MFFFYLIYLLYYIGILSAEGSWGDIFHRAISIIPLWATQVDKIYISHLKF